MIEFKIFIGLNDKHAHKQLYKNEYYINEISKRFDNCTIQLGTGLYRQEKENTIILNYIANDNEKQNVYNIVNHLKLLFNQECILVTETLLNKFELV